MAIVRSYQPSAQDVGQAAYKAGAGMTALEDRRIAEQRAFQEQQRQSDNDFRMQQMQIQQESAKDAFDRQLQAKVLMDNLSTRNNIAQMQAQQEMQRETMLDRYALDRQAAQEQFANMTQRERQEMKRKAEQFQTNVANLTNAYEQNKIDRESYRAGLNTLQNRAGIMANPEMLKKLEEPSQYRTWTDPATGEEVTEPIPGTPAYERQQRELAAAAQEAALEQRANKEEADRQLTREVATLDLKKEELKINVQKVEAREKQLLALRDRRRKDVQDRAEAIRAGSHRDVYDQPTISLEEAQDRARVLIDPLYIDDIAALEQELAELKSAGAASGASPAPAPATSSLDAPIPEEYRESVAIYESLPPKSAEIADKTLIELTQLPQDSPQLLYALRALEKKAAAGDMGSKVLLDMYRYSVEAGTMPPK